MCRQNVAQKAISTTSQVDALPCTLYSLFITVVQCDRVLVCMFQNQMAEVHVTMWLMNNTASVRSVVYCSVSCRRWKHRDQIWEIGIQGTVKDWLSRQHWPCGWRWSEEGKQKEKVSFKNSLRRLMSHWIVFPSTFPPYVWKSCYINV